MESIKMRSVLHNNICENKPHEYMKTKPCGMVDVLFSRLVEVQEANYL